MQTTQDEKTLDRPVQVSRRELARVWAKGTLIAAVLVTIAYLIATSLADPLVVEDIGAVGLANVLTFTVLGATFGIGLAIATTRLVRKPRLTFVAVSWAAVAGYSVLPFTAAESIHTAIWLNIFHLLVAVPVIGLMARQLPRDAGS